MIESRENMEFWRWVQREWGRLGVKSFDQMDGKRRYDLCYLDFLFIKFSVIMQGINGNDKKIERL